MQLLGKFLGFQVDFFGAEGSAKAGRYKVQFVIRLPPGSKSSERILGVVEIELSEKPAGGPFCRTGGTATITTPLDNGMRDVQHVPLALVQNIRYGTQSELSNRNAISMGLDCVESLMHELGHAFHLLFGRSIGGQESNFFNRLPIDILETPSQMFESLLATPAFMKELCQTVCVLDKDSFGAKSARTRREWRKQTWFLLEESVRFHLMFGPRPLGGAFSSIEDFDRNCDPDDMPRLVTEMIAKWFSFGREDSPFHPLGCLLRDRRKFNAFVEPKTHTIPYLIGRTTAALLMKRILETSKNVKSKDTKNLLEEVLTRRYSHRQVCRTFGLPVCRDGRRAIPTNVEEATKQGSEGKGFLQRLWKKTEPLKMKPCGDGERWDKHSFAHWIPFSEKAVDNLWN